MNLKKVTKKLSKVRDNVRQDGEISAETEQMLKSLITDALMEAPNELKNLPNKNKITSRMPLPENDNTPLTSEQKFRLRLMEKTGTGSVSIH